MTVIPFEIGVDAVPPRKVEYRWGRDVHGLGLYRHAVVWVNAHGGRVLKFISPHAVIQNHVSQHGNAALMESAYRFLILFPASVFRLYAALLVKLP